MNMKQLEEFHERKIKEMIKDEILNSIKIHQEINDYLIEIGILQEEIKEDTTKENCFKVLKAGFSNFIKVEIVKQFIEENDLQDCYREYEDLIKINFSNGEL